MNTATVTAPEPAPAKVSTEAVSGNYYLAIGYLRAFITLLVLAHHRDAALKGKVLQMLECHRQAGGISAGSQAFITL